MDNYDIYIVGGGLVGLILLKELKKMKKNVCLIESNLEELNQGYVSKDSLAHSPIDEYRFRGLGGSGKAWGGGCTFFEKEDFDNWEFDYDEFMSCYEKACNILGVNFEILKTKKSGDIFTKEFISEQFKTGFNLISQLKGGNIFNKIFDTKELKKDIFYGSLLRFEHDIMVFNNNKDEMKLSYKKCILCCGGLETTRILLNSNLKNDNLGKYYSAHLSLKKGKVITNKDVTKKPMYIDNGSKYLIYKGQDNLSIRVIIQDNMELILQGDQIPCYKSNLTLSDNKDKFNSKKLILNHQATKADFERIIECYAALDNQLKEQNIGYLTEIPTIEDISSLTVGASHHLGTTRFGKTSFDGVVNYNFELFDLKNVFVISSSLYPTYSHAHPSLTLIALMYKFLEIHYND